MFHYGYSTMFGWNSFPNFGAGLALLVIWSLVWKGLVLWLTARRGQTAWFVVFMIINTAGIGEIIYLLATNGFNELKSKTKD